MARGWRQATIAGIARAAGVSGETIYAVFGSKKALLEAVVASAVRGQDTSTPLLQQDGPKLVNEAVDQRQQIALFAVDITKVLGRVAPIIAVVRAAAEADPEIEALYRALHEGRRRNLAFVVDAIAGHGAFRQGLSRDAALATVWRLTSPELFILITQVEGLSADQYGHWLKDVITTALIGDLAN